MAIYYSPSSNGFYTNERHGDAIPLDKIEITEDEWVIYRTTNKDIVVTDGVIELHDRIVTIPNPMDQYQLKLATKLIDIDKFILDSLAQLPYNYTSFEELMVWLDDKQYGTEARALLDWAKECYRIQDSIINGLVIVDSLDGVYALLPKFPL